MTRWIPVDDPAPPDDYHVWARAEADACPNCTCCSARLCQQAIEADRRGDVFGNACHFIGSSGDFNLAECPCWRDLPGSRPVPADHPYRRVTADR